MSILQKLIFTVALALFVLIPNVSAQDLGAPDSLIMIPSELEAGGNDSTFTLELWMFNDAQGIVPQIGFSWDSDLITLDSAKMSEEALSFISIAIYYDESIETSNARNRALFAAIQFMWSGLPSNPSRHLLATYYFTVSDWTVSSELLIDTASWDDGSELLFVPESDDPYVPVWAAGDEKIVVRDVNVHIQSPVDLGAADSLIMIHSELEAGGNDSLLTLEFWAFNDANEIAIQFGFNWDYDLLTLDSARTYFNGWSQTYPYGQTIEIANANNRANFISIFNFAGGGLVPSPDHHLLATYYFSVVGWTVSSKIFLDSTAWDNGSKMLFYTTTDEIYLPVWSGGNRKIVVRDINLNQDGSCCGAYTGGQTGNIDCDINGERNLADLTRLIDRIYLTKTALCCEANGNVDGDLAAKMNLSDITSLIDHIYLSKTETAICQ